MTGFKEVSTKRNEKKNKNEKDIDNKLKTKLLKIHKMKTKTQAYGSPHRQEYQSDDH